LQTTLASPAKVNQIIMAAKMSALNPSLAGSNSDFTKMFRGLPDNVLTEAPPIELIPSDAATVAGVYSITDKALYWPAMPGSMGFKVMEFANDTAAKYLVMSITGALSDWAEINTGDKKYSFILNLFYMPQAAERLFKDRTQFFNNGTGSLLSALCLWPIMWMTQQNQSVREGVYDQVPWLEVIMGAYLDVSDTNPNTMMVDVSNPMFSPLMTGNFEQGSSMRVRVEGLDRIITMDDMEKLNGHSMFPRDTNGQIDRVNIENVSQHYAYIYGMYDPSFLPASFVNPKSSPATELFAVLTDMLEIWEKRILKQTKGVSTVTMAVPVTQIAIGTIHRGFLRLMKTWGTKVPGAGVERALYSDTLEALDTMVTDYAKWQGVRKTTEKHVRSARFEVGGASKGVIDEYQNKGVRTGMPVARAFSSEDIVNSLQVNDDDINPKGVKAFVPRNLLAWMAQRSGVNKQGVPRLLKRFQDKTMLEKRINGVVRSTRGPEEYVHYMYFMCFFACFLYAQYFMPYKATNVQTSDLDLGKLPTKFMERMLKLFGLYIQDMMDESTGNIFLWEVDAAQQAQLKACLKRLQK